MGFVPEGELSAWRRPAASCCRSESLRKFTLNGSTPLVTGKLSIGCCTVGSAFGVQDMVSTNPQGSVAQIQEVCFPTITAASVSHRLTVLRRRGLLDCLSHRTFGDRRAFWGLTALGRAAAAGLDGAEPARPGAPVAMPLEWKELKSLKSASQFTMNDVLKRLKNKSPAKPSRQQGHTLPSERSSG